MTPEKLALTTTSSARRPRSEGGADNALAAELTRLLGPKKVLSSLSERLSYRFDAIQFGVTPLAVVLPESTEDVIAAVQGGAARGRERRGARRGERPERRRGPDEGSGRHLVYPHDPAGDLSRTA